jgi:rfaE bifunctional protein nucleotidyltransferase chain/domain
MDDGKIVDIKNLAKLSARLKSDGKKIVTTNGVFDLLHVGHVRYLKKARSLGDVLIVGINSDSSVKKLKGNKRPLVSELQRAEVLAALECVDFVCIFEEPTPIRFILQVKPNVHAKGGDYDPNLLPEKKIVEQNGGLIRTIKFEKGFSTTSLIDNIVGRFPK